MRRAVAAAACVALVCAAAAGADVGGSATYAEAAGAYDFNLFNGGTTAWQYFMLVGAAGTRFVGGTTTNEGSARCVVGPPDEIECGPVSANVIPPGGHLGFVATLGAAPACGAPFQLYASATGAVPFTRVGDATFAGNCTAASAPPTIHGVPRVGHTLTARAPTWGSAPLRVTYRWQLCRRTACVSITGATRLTLRLTKRMQGHAVRVTATATFVGATVASISRRIGVR